MIIRHPPGKVMSSPLQRLLLFHLPNRRIDLVLTIAVGLVVIWSRFALLADGPWEWDETLFARGILHFELAAHFPHPPGFPGWLAIGHLLSPLVRDPLSALQLASAGFSVAALWVLAALGRRIAPPSVAVAAALVVLAAPGPWLYAVRGFTTTAASVLALGAAALAAAGLQGRRTTAFTLLVTASFLIRPNLLPVLAVLWLGVALGVRPRKRLLPGLAFGSMSILAAIVLMARAEGGWRSFVVPFLDHSRRHFSRLAAEPGGLADLGLLKGFGGTATALAVLLLAAAGIVVWARRVGRRGAWLWAGVLVVAVVQLVWMQNRTYCRYAVGVQMALAPLAAGAAAVAPPAVACGGLLALAGWFGAQGLPLVEEQHHTQLPAWAAVQQAREVALVENSTVVLEPELYPFASYLWHVTERRGERSPPWVLSPWDPGPWAGVDGPYVLATIHRGLYPDSLYGREQEYGGVSAALQPLTQQRFLEAWMIEGAPLPLEGWWPAEHLPEGRRFMWGGVGAEMLLPPLPGESSLYIAARTARGRDPVVIELDDTEVARLEGEGGEQHVELELSHEDFEKTSLLRFRRVRGWVPGGGDSRSLAVQLFEMRAFAPDLPWAGPVARDWQREALRVELDGAWGAEEFPGIGEGVWLRPRAQLVVPAREGELGLCLWAPRPTPPATVLYVGDRKVAGPLALGPRPETITLRLGQRDFDGGRCRIEIVSEAYVPAEGGDRRQLGVVISDVSFSPLEAAP